MAEIEMQSRITLPHHTASVWNTNNTILMQGELGYESDTLKYKFGDGVTPWNSLSYASANPAKIKTAAPTTSDTGYDVGTMWLNTTDQTAYVLFSISGASAVWKQIVTSDMFASASVASAGKFTTARTVTFLNDVLGSMSFDGSANVNVNLTLKETGLAAGTYIKVTVDKYGRVVSVGTLAASDIPDLTLSKVSDAGTAAAKDVGTGAGNVPVIDASGKLSTSIIPQIAITTTTVVASEAAMLALTAQPGDIALRSDTNTTWILVGDDPTTIGNWTQLYVPASAVQSVNGHTGIIVLSTSDIAEGTNLYWTAARFAAAIAGITSDAIAEGSQHLYYTDDRVKAFLTDTDNTFILNGQH